MINRRMYFPNRMGSYGMVGGSHYGYRDGDRFLAPFLLGGLVGFGTAPLFFRPRPYYYPPVYYPTYQSYYY